MMQPKRSLILASEIPVPDWDQKQAESFEGFADEVFAPIYSYICQDIAQAWGRSLQGARVLEIGGGPGNMAVELLKRGVASLTGLDVSEAMLERTVQRLQRHADLAERFTQVPGDAGRLPFPDQTFDLVFSRGSIQFWPDISAALREIGRVTGVQGLAFVGGGYGLSTPPEVKTAIHREREARMAKNTELKPIPQLNHEEIFAFVNGIGGVSSLERDGPAFWLQWFPHGR